MALGTQRIRGMAWILAGLSSNNNDVNIEAEYSSKSTPLDLLVAEGR